MSPQEERPNPDSLLAAIQEEESRERQGKLKIFLGMCAGVGKTYAMLQDARQRRLEGIQVAAAVVLTHGRPETELLLKDLPVIPLRAMPYRGVILWEMDLDAILAQRPQLVLVDELAHSNAPGSRHPKRWQDVQELLAAGINVYTTVNIQHLESRVDAVSRITGVRVQETVPDSLVDRADELQLIDVTPEQLRERLAEGKVYLGEKAATAADHFFREENLTALREMALRLTAERVGQTLRGVIGTLPAGRAWRTNERPLVAVGPSPYSERLIRWARRMAAAQDTPWLAAYVETSRPLSEGDKASLEKNLTLARELGAKVVVRPDEDVARALLEIAQQQNATQIIVGQDHRPRLFQGGNLAQKLIRRSDDIDIYVFHAETPARRRPFRLESRPIRTWLQESSLAAAAVGGLTLLGWFAQSLVSYWALALLYLVLVVLMALRFQRLTIVWAATLSALGWDYFFMDPVGRLFDRNKDWLILILFYAVTLSIGLLTTRIRLQALAERRRDQRTQALYRMAQSGVESTNLDEAIRRVVQEISGLFLSQAAILLADDQGELVKRSPADWMDDKEEGVAAWAFVNNHPAGCFTDTLPESQAIYLPLRTSKGKTGVLAVRLTGRKSLGLEERELLEAITDQIAVMMERYLLMQQANQARVAEKSERISNAIFDSISHELKTPLDAIMATADKLGAKHFETMAERATLADEIREAGIRLRRTVDNLLGMSRIESGRLQLKLTWCEVAELVQAARQQVADVLANHRVRGTLGPELPLVKLDFGLMVHALSNLLTNAAYYSPAGSEIRISAHIDGRNLVLQISDEGPGLPVEANRIFEKFYRGPNAISGGSGLGLSIVRALVQAHGGEVTAENNPGQGATFTIRIPVGVTPLGKETTLA